MLYNNDAFEDDRNNHSEQEPDKPNAYRVGDDNVEEKDLKKSLLFGKDETKPVREGEPMGGHSFGENNLTNSGDDKNNPSQNAGYTNAYFKRTEPSEEHPEYTNFKPTDQEGRSDYDKAMPKLSTEENDNDGDKAGNGDKPKPQQGYEEGTADNSGNGNNQPNIPGPNEVPDQQKVGEKDDDTKEHIET